MALGVSFGLMPILNAVKSLIVIMLSAHERRPNKRRRANEYSILFLISFIQCTLSGRPFVSLQ